MNWKHTLVIAAALALAGSVAFSAKPFRAAGGVQSVPQAAWDGDEGTTGYYVKTGVGMVFHADDDTETTLGAPGGGGGGSGTVTSVALSVPAIMSVAGSPVTTSGTLAVSLATQSANRVWSGPTGGGAATPTFRALVAADLPAGTGTVTSVATDATLTASTEPIVATGTLSINLGNANTWTASQNVASVALSDGANIATNAALGNVFTVTLGGNRTLDNPTNMVAGGTYLWVVTQDGTGSRTLAYGNAFKWPAGVIPTLSTAAGAVDMVSCLYTGSTLKCVAQLDFQ